MDSIEVDDLLANRVGDDHSLRPAPTGAQLSPDLVAQVILAARRNKRNDTLEDGQILYRLGAVDELGLPTLAGLLVLGDAPQRFAAASRVTYRRLPTVHDPVGTRFSGHHPEGCYGELLDDMLAAVAIDVDTPKVVVDGQMYDELDVPREALREICSNALVHRSLAVPLDSTSVEVEVSDRMVVITSPGGLHEGNDLRTLGLGAMSSLRNPSLVRISELSTTPSGARIVESQSSGIAASDRACRRFGTMPPLFVSRRAHFEAILLRGALPTIEVTQLWAQVDIELDADDARLVGAGVVLDELQNEDPGSHLSNSYLDSSLAARLLTTTVESGAQSLGALADAGVLVARGLPDRTVWTVRTPARQATAPGTGVSRPNRSKMTKHITNLLRALAGSPNGELATKELLVSLGVSSNKTVATVVKHAMERGLIEPTRESPHDPQRKYRLTETGKNSARG
jgi:ATP-dependent DNA helicase RecG